MAAPSHQGRTTTTALYARTKAFSSPEPPKSGAKISRTTSAMINGDRRHQGGSPPRRPAVEGGAVDRQVAGQNGDHGLVDVEDDPTEAEGRAHDDHRHERGTDDATEWEGRRQHGDDDGEGSWKVERGVGLLDVLVDEVHGEERRRREDPGDEGVDGPGMASGPGHRPLRPIRHGATVGECPAALISLAGGLVSAGRQRRGRPEPSLRCSPGSSLPAMTAPSTQRRVESMTSPRQEAPQWLR